MITNFKQFNENLLVPRNLEGRKKKLKQMNIRLLSQEVIDGYLYLDEFFMNIDAKFVNIKKVNGYVWLTGRLWTEIPEWLKDVEIEGYFRCSDNKLITLKNCPQNIGTSFWCSDNKLTSLEGCPENVGKGFSCAYNKLTSLKGCPETVGGDFYCLNNQLISLEGCPENIEGSFWCYNNKLTSLEGCPKSVGGNFYCFDNKIKLELPDYVKLKGEFIN
mgnify:CR=1 FL=1